MAYKGSTKAFVLEAYVEHFLAPTLRSGQIAVMDSMSAHKADRGRDLSRPTRGAVVVLAYSPDLNLKVEVAFSEIRVYLEQVAARTKETLLEAMGQALAAVTSQDAKGLTHCGYELEDPSL